MFDIIIDFLYPSMEDKIGLLISMFIMLLILIGFEIKSWWENRK